MCIGARAIAAARGIARAANSGGWSGRSADDHRWRSLRRPAAMTAAARITPILRPEARRDVSCSAVRRGVSVSVRSRLKSMAPPKRQ